MNTFILLFGMKGHILRYINWLYIYSHWNLLWWAICLKRQRRVKESLKSLAISLYCLSSDFSCTKGSMISCLQTWNIHLHYVLAFFPPFIPASEMFVKEQFMSIYSLLLIIMILFFYSILTALLFEFPWRSFEHA